MIRRLFICTILSLAAFSASGATLHGIYTPANSSASLYFFSSLSGGTWYDYERKVNNGPWTLQVHASAPPVGWTQNGLSANTTYVYRVIVRDAAQNILETTNPVLFSTHTHTNDPLTSNDLIRLQHMQDLRTVVTSAINASGGTATWTNPTLTTNSVVADEDVLNLRTNFNTALSNLGFTAGYLPNYVDGVEPGLPVLRAHLQQMRNLTRTYPEYVYAAAFISNPFFSPNADGVKDTTSFSSAVVLFSNRQDFRWRVDVRRTNATLVRSATGTGQSVSWVWDGRDGVGTLQPEGTYIFELIDLDSINVPIAQATTYLDLTAPTASITAPADNTVISNVYTNGAGTANVSGNAADAVALENWSLDQTGNSLPDVSIATGTGPISGALATWQAATLPNGSYVLKFRATDSAGNTATDTVPVTVGHFSASRSVAQANVSAGATVTYTSIVPFTMNEKIELKRNGVPFRTLFDGQRTAGTYNDVWDGLDAQGGLAGDGAYQYYVTLTAGPYSYIWDRSTAPSAGPPDTQYEYPKCWDGALWRNCDDSSANFAFDPYAGKPLRIAWCVGSGHPDTGCTGTVPALVVAKATFENETSSTCDSNCFLNELRIGGLQELSWYGFGGNGTWLGGRPNMTIIRMFQAVPENLTLVYGTAPTITSVTIDPPMFSPGAVPSPSSGQSITVQVTRYANRPVSLTAAFLNSEYGMTLRTLSTTAQASNVLTLSWDGRADNGERVAPGKYVVTLTVTDSTGSSVTIRPVMVVRY